MKKSNTKAEKLVVEYKTNYLGTINKFGLHLKRIMHLN